MRAPGRRAGLQPYRVALGAGGGLGSNASRLRGTAHLRTHTAHSIIQSMLPRTSVV